MTTLFVAIVASPLVLYLAFGIDLSVVLSSDNDCDPTRNLC
jgi:hypothetical protein